MGQTSPPIVDVRPLFDPNLSGEGGSIVVITSIDGLLPRALERLMDLVPVSAAYICDRLKVAESLAGSLPVGSSIQFSEDCLSRESLEEVDSAAYRLIDGWHLCQSMERVMTYEGVSIGSLLQWDLAHVVPFVLKKAKLVMWAISEYAPTRLIVLARESESNRWRSILGAMPSVAGGQVSAVILTIDDEQVQQPVKKSRGRRWFLDLAGLIIARSLYKLQWQIWFRRRRVLLVRRNAIHEGVVEEISIDRSVLPVLFDERVSPYIAREHYRGLRAGRYHYAFSLDGVPKRPVAAAVRNAKAAWAAAEHDESLAELFLFEKASMWLTFKPAFDALVEERVVELVGMIGSIRQGLERLRPVGIVLHLDSSPFERALCLVAGDMGIPTIVIQHGIQAELHGQDKIYADKMCVWGQAHSERYVAHGNHNSKLVETGNPGFDRFVAGRPGDAKEVRRRVCDAVGLDWSKKLLTLAARTNTPDFWFSAFRYEDQEPTLFAEVLNAVRQMSGVQLLVKLHPGDRNPEVYHRLLEESGVASGTVAIVQRFALDDALIACDAVVTHGSTVALEAMILNRPVVIANFTEREDLIPYAGEGPAAGVYQRKDLLPALINALTLSGITEELEQMNERFIGRYAGKLDGLAAARVAAVIREAIN